MAFFSEGVSEHSEFEAKKYWINIWAILIICIEKMIKFVARLYEYNFIAVEFWCVISAIVFISMNAAKDIDTYTIIVKTRQCLVTRISYLMIYSKWLE